MGELGGQGRLGALVRKSVCYGETPRHVSRLSTPRAPSTPSDNTRAKRGADPIKLRRHREHNYVKKLHRLIALGALPVGVGLHQLDIRHDAWCRRYKGKSCNYDPDLELHTVWTPRPQG